MLVNITAGRMFIIAGAYVYLLDTVVWARICRRYVVVMLLSTIYGHVCRVMGRKYPIVERFACIKQFI